MRQLLAWRRLSGAALALVLVVTVAASASGAPNDDPRAERDRVRRQAAEVAAQVNALQGNQADVSAALGTLAANVAAEEAKLADAKRAAQEAATAAAVARAAADAAAAELSGMEDQVRGLAVQAYMAAGADDEAEVFLESDNLGVAIQRRELLQHRQGSQTDSVDRLRAAREDMDIARADADAASQRAAEQQAAVEQQLTSLQTARDQQQTILNDVEARLDASLSEAAGLATLDAQLSQQIAQQEAELAARARAAAAAAAAAAARSGGGGGSSGGGSSGGGGGGGGGGSSPPSNPFPAGDISLVTVRGITVNAQIASALESMLAAAEADGYSFAGSGYRSPDAQWALRQAHCPDPVNSPPSACSPPTARVGSSMHELGLAIDFTYNGRLISSRSNAGYAWLAAHANGYGFYNLPSEPWHWSVNGT